MGMEMNLVDVEKRGYCWSKIFGEEESVGVGWP